MSALPRSLRYRPRLRSYWQIPSRGVHHAFSVKIGRQIYEGVLHCCRRCDVRCTRIHNWTGCSSGHQNLIHVAVGSRSCREHSSCPKTSTTTKCIECGHAIPPIEIIRAGLTPYPTSGLVSMLCLSGDEHRHQPNSRHGSSTHVVLPISQE